MKLSLIQSVGLIAKAISRCVKKQGYIFSRKQELITVMLASIITIYQLTCSFIEITVIFTLILFLIPVF